jgi:hypothetical protein
MESSPVTNEALAFLKRCTDGKHRIVCTGDLTEFQIAEARCENKMFVDADGFGYVLLPWTLCTAKDKQRESNYE